MQIWYVDAEDSSCAWSTREKAIEYVMGECKQYGWELKEHDSLGEVTEWFKFTKGKFDFEATIYPIYLDEKPYEQYEEI